MSLFHNRFHANITTITIAGDNDHKHGPHFHDINYHVHDPRDEAHMKKRDFWLQELSKDPLKQKVQNISLSAS